MDVVFLRQEPQEYIKIYGKLLRCRCFCGIPVAVAVDAVVAFAVAFAFVYKALK